MVSRKGDRAKRGPDGARLSLLVTAIGAILRYAYTPTSSTHGFHLGTIGAILMIIGIIGAVAPVVDWAVRQDRIRRTHRTISRVSSPGSPTVVERIDADSSAGFRLEWDRVRDAR